MANILLLDTNILLDVLLNREPLVNESRKIWQANLAGQITAYITATSLTNIYYYASKAKGSAEGLKAVNVCLKAFEICKIDREILELAAAMRGRDYEDDIQSVCALIEGLDAVVTRDIKGFRDAGIKLYTPAQLIKEMKLR